VNQSSDRIPCPSCGAENFPSSATCWQCGAVLQTNANGQSGPPPGAPPPGGSYNPPPSPPSAPYSTPQPNLPQRPMPEDTNTLIIFGYVCVALSFLCCPWLFGVAAVIIGVVAGNKGDQRGKLVWILGIVGLVVGTIIGLIWSTYYFKMMNQFMQHPGQNPYAPQFPQPPGGYPHAPTVPQAPGLPQGPH